MAIPSSPSRRRVSKMSASAGPVDTQFSGQVSPGPTPYLRTRIIACGNSYLPFEFGDQAFTSAKVGVFTISWQKPAQGEIRVDRQVETRPARECQRVAHVSPHLLASPISRPSICLRSSDTVWIGAPIGAQQLDQWAGAVDWEATAAYIANEADYRNRQKYQHCRRSSVHACVWLLQGGLCKRGKSHCHRDHCRQPIASAASAAPTTKSGVTAMAMTQLRINEIPTTTKK